MPALVASRYNPDLRDKPRMPFLSRPLPDIEIDLIERWIAAGLPEFVVKD